VWQSVREMSGNFKVLENGHLLFVVIVLSFLLTLPYV